MAAATGRIVVSPAARGKAALRVLALDLLSRGEKAESLEALRAYLGLGIAEQGFVERLSAIEAKSLNSAHLLLSAVSPATCSNDTWTCAVALLRQIEDVFAVEIEDSPACKRALVQLMWRSLVLARSRGEKLPRGAISSFVVAGRDALYPPDDLQDWLFHPDESNSDAAAIDHDPTTA